MKNIGSCVGRLAHPLWIGVKIGGLAEVWTELIFQSMSHYISIKCYFCKQNTLSL
jgi:hypothetical protein